MPVLGASAEAGPAAARGGAELCEWLLPHLAGLAERAECTEAGLVVWARSRAAGACCPGCGAWSVRVHSEYARRLQDIPAGARPVVIVLAVRRFFCDSPACPAVTFAEQAAGLSQRYRRRSIALQELLGRVGLALAGRAGARLAAVLGIAVHRSTLLGLVMALPEPPARAPEVLGVDDFALRRGHVYGTVLVDVTTGTVTDLLPDREAGTVAAWLRAHPGTRVICRDRAGAYAEGARDGAPGAVQVADRWHLWDNLAGYVAGAVTAHHGCLTRPPPGPAAPAPATPPGTLDWADGRRDAEGRERRLIPRTVQRHAAVHDLLAAGQSLTAIGQALGLHRETVRRYARAADPAALLVPATTRDSQLDPWKPLLHQRWDEGLTDARRLHAEIAALGFTGSDQAVRRYVRPFRQLPAAPPPRPAAPTPRQLTRWLLTRPDHLRDDQRAALAASQASCPHLNALAGHVTAFAQMMTGRHGSQLGDWLAAVEADDQPQLHSLAAGIRRDLDAVTSGLTQPWSSGKVEGTVNKIKTIKRQMYGRASFALLRKRVLLYPP
jgi:transposase